MRDKLPDVVEQGRIMSGPLSSDASYGRNGAFVLTYERKHLPDVELYAICSDGSSELKGDDLATVGMPVWEHVSVSVKGQKRTATWDEMCFVKSLFWDDEEAVVQYHPAKSDYVNMHPTTLHLWRPVLEDLPTPPPIYVGVGRKV